MDSHQFEVRSETEVIDGSHISGIYIEQSDINALLSASESYMLERQEAAEIIEEVRATITDWRKTATELQIPIKLLQSYSMRWDEL